MRHDFEPVMGYKFRKPFDTWMEQFPQNDPGLVFHCVQWNIIPLCVCVCVCVCVYIYI